MTPEQIKIAVARELGWTQKEYFETSFSEPRKQVSRGLKWYRPNGIQDRLDDFLNDRNTQPEMLAAMTEEEKQSLCKLHLGADRNFPFNAIALTLILELSQLTFCELFLKVKGKWVDLTPCSDPNCNHVDCKDHRNKIDEFRQWPTKGHMSDDAWSDFMDALSGLSKAKKQIDSMRVALQQLSECDLNESNCASFEVANKRIRNIAKRALAGENI